MSAEKVSLPRTDDKPAEQRFIHRFHELAVSEATAQRIRESLHAALLRHEARRLRRGK